MGECPKCGSASWDIKWNAGYSVDEARKELESSVDRSKLIFAYFPDYKAAGYTPETLAVYFCHKNEDNYNARRRDTRFDEHLDITCTTCGYYWEDDCDDAEAK